MEAAREVRRIAVVGAKGGQGASVAAASLALVLAEGGVSVGLFADETGDVLGAVGMPDYGRLGTLDVLPAGVSTAGAVPWRFLVSDGPMVDADATVLVVRSEYLALRRWVTAGSVVTTPAPAVALLLVVPGSALGRRDVEGVMGLPVVDVEVSSSVARAVDAGLLPLRLAGAWRRAVEGVAWYCGALDVAGVSS